MKLASRLAQHLLHPIPFHPSAFELHKCEYQTLAAGLDPWRTFQ
jgi:hypothetical protein